MTFEEILPLGICGVILILLFLWIVYRIPRQFRSRGWLFGIGFVGICSIPFILDLSFSLGIKLGFTLSISCVTLSIFYLLLTHQKWNPLTVIAENHLYQDEVPEVWQKFPHPPELKTVTGEEHL